MPCEVLILQPLPKFDNITKVPAVMSTIFNNYRKSIIRTPKEAIRSIFAMGLGTSVLNEIVVEKGDQQTEIKLKRHSGCMRKDIISYLK